MADNYKPNNNFESEINSDDFDERINTVEVNNLHEDIEIQNEQSQLASTPGKNIILLLLAGLVSIYVIYSIAFKTDPNYEKAKKLEEIIKSQPVESAVQVHQPVDSLEVQEGIVLPDIKTLDEEQAPVIGLDSGSFRNLSDSLNWPSLVNDTEKKYSDQYSEKSIDSANQESNNDIVDASTNNIFVAPALPEDDEIKVETPPLPPIDNKVSPGDLQLAQLAQEKRRRPMILKGTAGVPSDLSSAGKNGLEATSSETVKATFIGDTDTLIAQGKIIDVVLESAINTNLEGVIRGVISRNIYAESGKNILIPKGSRLIGAYGGTEANSNRVAIIWNRVIMPDGVDVQIGSPGTDVMGRAGIAGFVDRKFFDIFSNAVLLSVVTIAGAAFVDEVTDAQQQTTSTTTAVDGASTTSSTGNSTDAAVLDSVNNMSDIANSITEGLLDAKPTVIIQQGTKMKVFVNKDIHFPSSIASRVQFIN
jgi:type IV secretory pathway VirB10-like protein